MLYVMFKYQDRCDPFYGDLMLDLEDFRHMYPQVRHCRAQEYATRQKDQRKSYFAIFHRDFHARLRCTRMTTRKGKFCLHVG
jgi:hypothetical protein